MDYAVDRHPNHNADRPLPAESNGNQARFRMVDLLHVSLRRDDHYAHNLV